MVLVGKIKKGLGNANFWVKKIEDIFWKKENIKLFYGTLNVCLEEPYEPQNYSVIKKEEYGGQQDVLVQKCEVLGHTSYILRPEKTAHKTNIIEIVSDVNFREKYKLKDEDVIKILVLN